MSDFIKPRFSATVAYEAILKKDEVLAYAQEQNISFDEAVEILGKEYVQKYHNYSQMWLEGVSKPIEMVKDG